MWKSLLGALCGLSLATAANASLIVTLTESDTGGVNFSLTAEGQFDGSFNLTHLGFVFFDNLGDPFRPDPFFDGASLQPLVLAPFGQVADDVFVPAIIFDGDPGGNDTDDLALRFIRPGLENGDTISGPFPLLGGTTSGIVQGNAFGLTFSMFNPGVYTSTDAQAQAFGGLELRIIEAAVIPLPAAGWLLLGGFGALIALRRRRGDA